MDWKESVEEFVSKRHKPEPECLGDKVRILCSCGKYRPSWKNYPGIAMQYFKVHLEKERQKQVKWRERHEANRRAG